MLKQVVFSLLLMAILHINLVTSWGDYNFRKEGELKESFGKLNILVKNLRQMLRMLMEYKRDKYLKHHKLPLDEVNNRVPDDMKIIPQLRRVTFQCSECNFNATAFLGLWKHMKVAHKIDIRSKPGIRMFVRMVTVFDGINDYGS
ncbi:hypothetical protein M8J75_001825 [Diaphorina citri]|nr:hypothetical protein M8J75_001825 [Diaphorina citri]